MVADVRPLDTFTFPRVVDLLQKTNQFNLTTRRYDVTDLTRFVESSEHAVLMLDYRDRFGDEGIDVYLDKAMESATALDIVRLSVIIERAGRIARKRG